MADRRVISPDESGLGWIEVGDPDVVVVDSLRVPNTFIAPSGGAFPGAPTNGELFWRTDQQALYRYNSTLPAWELTIPDPDGVAVAIGGISGNPHGFLNQTDTAISFVDGTQTFTIAPTGADFTYYRQGINVTKSAPENKIIANTDGLHFIYYDNTDTLQDSLTPWDLELHVPVATVHWNTTTVEGELGEERHTVLMEWRTHQYLHRANGTRYISGLTISGYVLNSDADNDVTVGVSDGTVYDEDIAVDIKHAAIPSARFEQVLADPAQIPVYYREGINGYWRKDAPTSFYFKNTAAGRVNWNQFTGATWQQAEGNNGYHVAYWIYATNHVENPVIAIQGQRQDNNLPDAQTNNTLPNLSFGTLPFQEMKVLYRVILQTGTAYGGTRKAKVQDVSDYRSVSNVPAGTFVPLTHASLGDLPTSGHPAAIIAADATAFAGVLTTADDTAQKAFVTVDGHNHGLKSGLVANVSFAGNPRKAAVVFTTAYPDTNYSIGLSVYTDGSNNAAYLATVESKLATGFTLSLHTGNINDVIDVEWITKPVGE